MTKRLEIIHLRLSTISPEGLCHEIRQSIKGHSESVNFHIYRHAKVMSDITIHLHLEDNGAGPQRSELGARITAALKDYGMVEHAVWIEVEES
jgi:Co/Zn/Cd efflux system component